MEENGAGCTRGLDGGSTQGKGLDGVRVNTEEGGRGSCSIFRGHREASTVTITRTTQHTTQHTYQPPHQVIQYITQ